MVSRKVVACTLDHLPELVDLLLGPSEDGDPVRRARLYDDIKATYFDHPWTDPAWPSLVYEDSAGHVAGFLGVMMRPMLLNGRPLRAAVSSNLRVRSDMHERYDPTIAVHLLKTLFRGAHDLSFTDAANGRSKRLWEACGGEAALLYSLDWLLPTRPSGLLLPIEITQRSARSRRLLRVLGRGVDVFGSILLRSMQPAPGSFGDMPFDAGIAAELLGRISNTSIRAVHNASSLTWLADMAARKALPGTFSSRIVTDRNGTPIGWYTHLQQQQGLGNVLDLVAANGWLGPVLDSLIRDAAARSVRLLRGTVNPCNLQIYRDHLCLLLAGRWTLIHARNPALMEAFRCGKAVLQGSDGERWMTQFDLSPTVVHGSAGRTY